MADAKLSVVLPSAHVPPHPMADPGYGKRSTPAQRPRTNHDFAHLPPREAAVAAYVDRLPEGADISVKTLAKHLPYGQCALRTALNRIQAAGHLRRGRERLETDAGGSRWITRSWWSRSAHDDAWWAAFTRGDVPEPEQPPDGRSRPTRSRAHIPRNHPLAHPAESWSARSAECRGARKHCRGACAAGAGASAPLRTPARPCPPPRCTPARARSGPRCPYDDAKRHPYDRRQPPSVCRSTGTTARSSSTENARGRHPQPEAGRTALGP
ncbi:hypothetical protein [Streptomyces yokosukanensis]|uniref:hypothetical protein n=1 Tax=Streptomyces yokosukanensis TaxID=67386 RepID=UPI000AD89F0A